MNKSQDKMKNTISGIKNRLEGIKSSLGEAEDHISELENKVEKETPRQCNKKKKYSKRMKIGGRSKMAEE